MKRDNHKDSSFMVISYLMKGINNNYNEEEYIADFLEKRFFEDFSDVLKNNDSEYTKLFFNKLFPNKENLRYYIYELEKLKQDKIISNGLESVIEEKLYKLMLKKRICENLSFIR